MFKVVAEALRIDRIYERLGNYCEFRGSTHQRTRNRYGDVILSSSPTLGGRIRFSRILGLTVTHALPGASHGGGSTTMHPRSARRPSRPGGSVTSPIENAPSLHLPPSMSPHSPRSRRSRTSIWLRCGSLKNLVRPLTKDFRKTVRQALRLCQPDDHEKPARSRRHQRPPSRQAPGR